MLEKILIAIVSAIATAIISWVISLIRNHSGKAKDRRKKEEQQARKEAVIEGLKDTNKELQEIKASISILKTGVQSHIRLDLRDEYNRHIKRGYAPLNIREDLEQLYNSYHNLGKNGVMDNLREKFLSLPTQPKNKTNKNEGE